MKIFGKKIELSSPLIIALFVVLVLQINRISLLFKFLFRSSNELTTQQVSDSFDVDYSYGMSQSEVKIAVRDLLQAMDVFSPLYGTDETTIHKIFKSLSVNDFKKIYKTFGTKPYNGTGLAGTIQIVLFGWSGSIVDADLVYWLKAELDPVKDKEVYNSVKSVVSKIGFTF